MLASLRSAIMKVFFFLYIDFMLLAAPHRRRIFFFFRLFGSHRNIIFEARLKIYMFGVRMHVLYKTTL